MGKNYPEVEIMHNRVIGSPKGGITSVSVYISEGCVIRAYSFCWQFETYNKKKGKSIAFGRLMRAIDQLGLSKSKTKKLYAFTKEKVGTIDERLFNLARAGEKIE